MLYYIWKNMTKQNNDDLTGMIFGRLTVVQKIFDTDKKLHLWQCNCICGEIRYLSYHVLKRGQNSCGCLKNEETSARMKISVLSRVNRIVDGKKICSQCNKLLPVEKFDRDKQKWCGYRPTCKKCCTINFWIKKYNVTKEYLLNLVELANNTCQICGIKTEDLYLDHNHTSNKIRNFLCFNCNTGLGHCKENKSVLMNIINYLNKYNKP